MMQRKTWLTLSILNLVIVALLGTVMRYKQIYSLPIIEQKHIQHAHSHFAFTAWITQTLFLIWLTVKDIPWTAFWRRSIVLHQVVSVGMLLAFSYKGYYWLSISLSMMALCIEAIWSVFLWKQSNKQKIEDQFFSHGLIFMNISAIGTFSLAYLMANHIHHLKAYLSSLYFFLHFQYNGWFLFASMAILIAVFPTIKETIKSKHLLLLTVSVYINYLLSLLWWPLPHWLFIVNAIFAIINTVIWIRFVQAFWKVKNQTGKISIYFIGSFLLAILLKDIAQLLSLLPYFSTVIYSIRAIVIGYLHLILLAGFTSLLLGMIIHQLNKSTTLTITKAGMLWLILIWMNELILVIQGLAGLFYISIGWTSLSLFVIAFLLVMSSIILLICIRRNDSNHKINLA